MKRAQGNSSRFRIRVHANENPKEGVREKNHGRVFRRNILFTKKRSRVAVANGTVEIQSEVKSGV